jgi:predicted CXXCH cytochrome family protein
MTKKRVVLAIVFLAAIAAAVTFAVRQRTPPAIPIEQVPAQWQEARTSPMHAAHVGRKAIACTECHGAGFEKMPADDTCTRCHAAPAKRAHRGSATSPTTCLGCHVFSAGKEAPSCVSCHATGARALAKHASPEIACASCHDLHGEKRSALVDCTGCHAGIGARHGRMEVAARDAGGGSAVGRFAEDAGIVLAARAVAPPSSAPLDATHASPGQVCGACHAPHAPAAKAIDACASCHAGPRATNVGAPSIAPRGPRVAGHAACITCHEPHRARKESVLACEGCHADRREAAQAKGHALCIGCHQPHAPTEARASCGNCHAGVSALAATKVKEHATCTSCHDPHRPQRAAASSCTTCHAAVKPSHPAAKGGACVGCHVPHPGQREGAREHAAVACSSCHTKAKGEKAFHAGKAACAECHRPHGEIALAGAGAAFCARCHQAPAAATATRTGHGECRKCHGEPHAPAKKPTCNACHAQEVATAPKGHAACTSCHDAHSGALGKNVSCTNCHADKSKALHGSIAQGCGSCHRPHGPKGPPQPPACTTCHAPAKLPGLHSVVKHAAQCGSCHVAHGAPRSDRATCTASCHQDRQTHQPDAAVCKGCHLFRR